MTYESWKKRIEEAEAEASTPEAGALLPELDARRFVDRITVSGWFSSRFPEVVKRLPYGVPIEVSGRSTRLQSGGAGITASRALVSRGLSRRELLHEIAHVCLGPDHDRSFAAGLLELWGHALGRDARRSLRAALARRRVPYRKPKTFEPEVLERLRIQGKVVLGSSKRERLGLWAPRVRSCCGLPMLQEFSETACSHRCSSCGLVSIEIRKE